jgi:hypothetical protein
MQQGATRQRQWQCCYLQLPRMLVLTNVMLIAASSHIEVEGIDDASVIIRHQSIGITAETVLKPIVTNCLNSVYTKK